eukprot:14106132-Ditylum_brightwellii.AAC.1
MFFFDNQLPIPVDEEQLEKNNSELSIDDVASWVGTKDSIEGCFVWWGTYARDNKFYQDIAKLLLSIGTLGSIDVEQKTKGLKYEILSQKQNKLSDDQAITPCV